MRVADLYNSPRGQFWIFVGTVAFAVTCYTVMAYNYFQEQERHRSDLYDEVKRESENTRREVRAAYERIEIRLQAAMKTINVTALDIKETVREASRLEDVEDEMWLSWEEEMFNRVLREIQLIGLACTDSGAFKKRTEP